MKTVKILRGPSGSGKSTIVRQIVAANTGLVDIHVVSADTYMYVDGVYKFDPSKLGQNHRFCFAEFCHTIGKFTFTENDSIVIVDNTNIKKWEYNAYVKVAVRLGWQVEYVVTPRPWDAELFAKRNAHGTPLDVICRMISEFEEEK